MKLSHRAWQYNLGLLPVPLYKGVDTDRRHVLLNGSAGNFCLDEQVDASPIDRATIAWSSNTGHHLTSTRDYVEVVRWDRLDKIERFTTASVAPNLEEFHRYLEKNTPDRLNSVVSHAIGVYRSLRSALHDERNGFASLSAFLYLLYCLESEQALNQAPAASFLPAEAAEVFGSIRPADQEYFAERLSGQVGAYRMMRPDLTLLLRHASGALFQEAHAQVELPADNWLPGLGPADALPITSPVIANGAYFTPPSIARTLAEEAVRHLALDSAGTIAVFDPACGSGELLKEVLRILEIRGFGGNVILQGWDLSPAAVAIATFSLGWEACTWNGRVRVDIRLMDSLHANYWPSDVDLIVMNPPFKSWQEMSGTEREAVSRRLGSLQANKPNLASVFIERASESLASNGVLSSVAPRSFFEGGSAAAVRAHISESFSIRLVANLANASLFLYAMVQSGLLIAKREAQGGSTTVVWTDPHPSTPPKALRALRRFQLEGQIPVVDDNFSVYKDPDLARDPKGWLARPYEAWALSRLLRNSGKFVAAKSLFQIHQGARIGSDAFLVDRPFWVSLDDKERRFFRPAVLNSTLEASRLKPDAYIFYPYTQGLPTLDSESALETHVPSFYEQVLIPNKRQLESRKSLVKAGQPWWGLIWPREWQYRPTQKLVSKYFGKQGAFAWDDNGEYVVVVGHGWVARDGRHWQHVDSREYAQCVVAILASNISEALFAQCSVQVGGGQWDLSKKYVGELMLPATIRANASAIRDLASFGAALAVGQLVSQEALNEAVQSVYGLRDAS